MPYIQISDVSDCLPEPAHDRDARPGSSRSSADHRRSPTKLDARTAELQEKNERYALVSQAVAEGIYDWDIVTNALWVSPRLIEIFGLTGEGLSAADWNARVHPDDFEHYRTALRDCFKAVTARLHCEYRIQLTNGEYRWVEDHGLPTRDGTGRAVRLVGAVSDITERKEAEQALREALERQTATAQILEVINRSPGNLAPVFEAMVERAVQLCEADEAAVRSFDGKLLHLVAAHGEPDALEKLRELGPSNLSRPGRPARLYHPFTRGERVVHIADVRETEAFRTKPHRAQTAPTSKYSHLARGGAAPRGHAPRRHQRPSARSPAVLRKADCAARKFRGAGGHRDGERAAARRIAASAPTNWPRATANSASASNISPPRSTCSRRCRPRRAIRSRCST